MPQSVLQSAPPLKNPSEVDDLDAVVEPLALELSLTDPEDHDRLTWPRESIVVLAVPLADGVAQRYRNRGIETDDLIQVARTALVKAVHRYRPGAGPGFAAYATPTISGELKRWFRDHGWAVRPPRRIQELRAALVGEEERLRHELGRDPVDAELALALGVARDEVGEARRGSAAYHSTSLDEPLAGGSSLADFVLVAEGPDSAIATRDALHRAISRLTERQRLVLRMRFADELTQAEIGTRIGVSQMQVSRILRGVLDRLRAELDDRPRAESDDTAA